MSLPIWPCSRWGLPCRSVAGLAVRSYRTISPLPIARLARAVRRYLSVALSVGSRRPGVTWHRALWSPDFPRHRCPPRWMSNDATVWPTPPRALSHARGRPQPTPYSPPYSALRGAPLSSAASFAACDGGRCSLSFAYRRWPSATLGVGVFAGTLRRITHEFALALVRHRRRRARADSASVPSSTVSNSLVSSRASTARRVAAERRGHVGQRFLDAVRGFVEHQRARFARQRATAVRAAPRPSPAGSLRTRSGRWAVPPRSARRSQRRRPAPADTRRRPRARRAPGGSPDR